MFRLQNNVPEVYVDKSRDFQLFCRLYDSCFGGVKFSIDSMSRLTNASILPKRRSAALLKSAERFHPFSDTAVSPPVHVFL